MALSCPKCKSALIQVPYHRGTRHLCPQRHGLAVMLSSFRGWLRRESRAPLEAALAAARAGKRPCPRCQAAMKEFRLGSIVLDECPSCGMAWFDAGEFEQSPRRSEEELTREDNGQQVTYSVEEGYEFNSNASPFDNIEGQKEGAPAFTILLIFSFCVAYRFALHSPQLFLFDADHPFRHFGIPIIGSLFAHADFWHFLGNSLFLFCAGGIIETTLGANALLGLFLVSGIAGHALTALEGHGLSLGSSGAISGIMAALVLTQPNGVYVMKEWRTVGLTDFYTLTWRIPLWMWAVSFFGQQIFLAAGQAHGAPSQINYLAHVGGALGGAAYVFLTDLKVMAPALKKA